MGFVVFLILVLCWVGATFVASRPWAGALPCAATGLLIAVTAVVYLNARHATAGLYYYPLDDAYIGMSVAKHLALYGIWGTSHAFASATSTPGFVLLLAMWYRLLGLSTYAPLVLALAGSIGCIFAADWILRGTEAKIRIPALLSVVLLTPLQTMALIGMEHSTQILLTLIFLGFASRLIVQRAPLDWRLLLFTALMVAVRYEGLFVAAGACLLLLLQRRWRDSLLLGAAAWLPVLGFGFYFRAHGGEWVPNSLLIKGGTNTFWSFVFDAAYIFPAMIAITWVAIASVRKPLTRGSAIVVICAFALWCHAFLGRYGWVYRYEAYLIAMSVVAAAWILQEQAVGGLLRITFITAAACLSFHALVATLTLPGRSRVMYSQQMQMAKLALRLNMPFAVNDLGAITYFSDVDTLDLVGLGSQDIMKARASGAYTTDMIRKAVERHGSQVIAVYDRWFENTRSRKSRLPWAGPQLPSQYFRVAFLYSPDPNGYAAWHTVTYYAATPEAADRLRAGLHSIEADLPEWDCLFFMPEKEQPIESAATDPHANKLPAEHNPSSGEASVFALR